MFPEMVIISLWTGTTTSVRPRTFTVIDQAYPVISIFRLLKVTIFHSFSMPFPWPTQPFPTQNRLLGSPGDFGFAARPRPPSYRLHTRMGSPDTVAPEVVRGEAYWTPVVPWSVTWEIFTQWSGHWISREWGKLNKWDSSWEYHGDK
jgi:hypothetical protein